MTNPIADLEHTPCLMIIGSNTAVAHPVIAQRIRQGLNKGTKLIVVDPRRTDMAARADIWLRLKVGTDISLLNAMAFCIIEEGLYDRSFVERATEGFEEFRAGLADYSPERAEEITGVPAGLIREAARTYATAPVASIAYCLGITEHSCGTNNVLSCSNLTLLTGNLGRELGGVNPLRGQNNVQGAGDMGCLPNNFPGYQHVSNDQVRRRFEEAWGVKLSGQVGLNKTVVFERVFEGKVKALYVMGENSVLSDANANHCRKALEALDFLVVQDIFLTETAKLADVVLPAASWGETEGTFTNTERRVQRVRQAVEPPGAARQDWRIIADLSRRLGYPLDYPDASAIWSEMASLVPIMAGISYARLEEAGIQWPCPSADHPGTSILHLDLQTDPVIRSKGKFITVEHVPPGEVPDGEYPLVLTTGRRLYHYHTGTQTRHAVGLEEVLPEELLEINPADAEALWVDDGERVRVTSRRGFLEVRTRVTEDVPRGTVFMTFHHWETPTNVLTNDVLDPIAGTPEFKACAVKVDKLAEAKVEPADMDDSGPARKSA